MHKSRMLELHGGFETLHADYAPRSHIMVILAGFLFRSGLIM